MTTAMITSKGQITIPKDVRSRLGVDTGDRIEFVEIQAGVFQIIATTRDVKSLKGIVPKPKQPVTIEEMNQAIAEKGASQ